MLQGSSFESVILDSHWGRDDGEGGGEEGGGGGEGNLHHRYPPVN